MADTTITVLNVDDNPAGLSAKSRVLRQAGFAVIEAATGADALQRVAADKPVLVLLNLERPESNGLEVCRRIKADPATATTLVLQISAALGDAQDQVRGLESGADGYLVDPVAPVELIATVRTMVRLWQREEENRQLRAQLQREVVERTAAEARHQQVEEALHESEERLRFALETSHTGMWDLDLVDHTAHRSLEHDRIFGYEQLLPQWTYDRFLDHVLPEDRAAVDAQFRQATATGSDWSFECRIRRTDGQVRWIWAAGRHRTDTAGQIRRMAGIVQDITARKQAEEALRASESRFRTLFETMNEGFSIDEIICDEAGKPSDLRYLEINPAFERHTGLKAADVLGRTTRELFPDAEPMWFKQYGKVALTGEPAHFEAQFGPLGRWFEVSAYQTEPGRFAVVFFDISERKHAEAALWKSEQRLSRAQEIAHLGSWELDLVNNVLTWSDEVYRIFGLRPQEFGATYEAFLERVHPDDRAAVDAAYTGSLRENHDTYEIEHRVVRQATDEIRIVHEKCEHFRDATGRIIRSVGMVHDITERQRAEETLRRVNAELAASLERLRLAQDAAQAGTWEWDLRTNENVWSETLWPLYGLEPHSCEPSYEAWRQTIHPEDRSQVEQVVQAAARQGIELNVEWRVRYRDGTEHWLMARGQPVWDADGQLVRYLGIVLDITERREVEQALRESQAQLQTVLENMTEGLIISTLDGHLVYWNRAALEMHGFSSIEEYRRRMPEFADTFELSAMNGTVLSMNQWPLARILRGEHLRDVEVHVRRINTDWQRIYNYGGALACDPDGRPLLAVVSVSDITQRKQAEEALRLSKERLASILSSLLDGVITVDEQQRITLLNPAAERLFGHCAADLLGQPLDRLIPERFRSAHTAHIRAFGQSNVTRRKMGELLSVYGLRTDGEEFPIEAAISQTEVAGQKLFTVILRDITERKQAEAALTQRTEELARSNQDLEQFAYVASHDLQEPLRAVAGCVQLLQKHYQGQMDERADEFITHAVEGAKRMRQLIDDLLAFSRVGTRGGPLQSVDSGVVLAAVLANLTVAIHESGAVITHDPLPTVTADPTQLTLLLQNLISNAIKFRREGSPRIHVGAQHQDHHWVLSVRDNGIGIEPQYFERIFGIFQRLHTRREYAGTGVGLAICKKIVERHGGRIWVESAPGAGCTFYCSLPDGQ